MNEVGDAFNSKGVTAKLKELKRPETEEEVALKKILDEYTSLSKEEKELKKEIKELSSNLHIKTKETIENLSEEQVNKLIFAKWITPIIEGLNGLPTKIIADLESKVTVLATKYDATLSGIEDEIIEAEKVLTDMLDDLNGNEFDLKGIAILKELLGGN